MHLKLIWTVIWFSFQGDGKIASDFLHLFTQGKSCKFLPNSELPRFICLTKEQLQTNLCLDKLTQAFVTSFYQNCGLFLKSAQPASKIMSCNLNTSLQTLPPSPNSTRWNGGFSPWIFSNQRLFLKTSLAKYRKICTQEYMFNVLWGLFFSPFHSKTSSVENFYAFAINYSLCNLTVFMESPLWMEQCASFSLLHVVLSLPLPQLESVLLGTLPRAWTDGTVQFCPTWYHHEVLCNFSAETMPSWHLCLSIWTPSLVSWEFFAGKKEAWASLPPWCFSFHVSCEVELGLFCQDNCMMVQQKLGLYSLPGTVWRKKHFLACCIFFYLFEILHQYC